MSDQSGNTFMIDDDAVLTPTKRMRRVLGLTHDLLGTATGWAGDRPARTARTSSTARAAHGVDGLAGLRAEVRRDEHAVGEVVGEQR